MARFLFIFVAALLLSDPAHGWKSFWKGRRVGGNVGHPSDIHGSLESASSEFLWFEQKLDHFEPLSDKTWNQRYYINDAFFQEESAPVFIMIGGEGEATAKWMHEGAWLGYAKKFGALMFQLEHRFYGKSHPTDDLSTENLRFLSSEQALADLAYFIKGMQQAYNLTSNNRWIAFGGSYPGSLAAWLREKYPHMVHGAVSSSGPLLAKVDFFEYFQVVTDSLGTYKQADCVTPVRKAIQQIELMLKHMVGQKTINEKYQLCDPVEKSIDNPLDIANLFESIAGNFAGVVQYNKDNRANNNVSIDDLCGIMTNQTIGAPVTRLAAVNHMNLQQSKQKCLDYKYDKMINDNKNTSWSSEVAEGGRQWTYQTCTEFGFYQTSDNKESVFGNQFAAEFFVQQCADIYGQQFTDRVLENAVDRTNIIYGAMKPTTTNVIYVHGSIDPWHALGLTKTDKNQPQPTIYIEGTAHCANMYEPTEKDPPQLKQARVTIEKFIEALLN